MAVLVDTNILVYRFDPRDQRKQNLASALLRKGPADNSIRVAFQAVVEFHSAVTRPLRGAAPLLTAVEATRETEELLIQFEILYPDEQVVRSALRATAAYGLSWSDAQMWAYADTNGLAEIVSEDFQHGRYYGGVRATNPFLNP